MDGPYENPDEKIEEFQKQKTTGEMLRDVINDILKQYNITAYENDEIRYVGIRGGKAYLLQKKADDGYTTISSVIPKPLLEKAATTIEKYIPINGLDKAIEGVERAKAELTLKGGEYILKFDMRLKQENTQAKETLEELFRKTMNYFLEQHGVKIDDIYGKENIKIENSNYQIVHSKNGDTIIYSTIPKSLLKEIANTVEKCLSLKSLDSAIEKVDEAGIAMTHSGKDYTIYLIIKTKR
jgi:hypothetical protein